MRYENHELEEGALASIFHSSQDEKPIVLQTIVLQDHEGLAVIDNSDTSQEVLDSLDREAQANLDAYELNFKYHPEYEQSIIVAQGPIFTCESVLSEEQMLKAHVMLDADEIMVAIPRRGIMLAASNEIQDELRQSFLGLHLYVWHDDKENDNLSRMTKDIFVLKHGVIEGVLYLTD